MESYAEMTDHEIGYLVGLIDGEGCVHVYYSKRDNLTFPRLRIYCTSKSIIDEACRIMRVKPNVRRDHGKLVGWYGQVSGAKAVRLMHIIAPLINDGSKKCRALTILKVFEKKGSIRERHRSAEIFAGCPPPARSRAQRERPGEIESTISPESTTKSSNPLGPLAMQTLASEIPAEKNDYDKGWLCGIVDGEGYIHVRYRSDRRTTYPRVRIFVKSRPIIDAAARVMGVNPYPRRSHGKQLGWYASVSHLKALRILQLIAPHLAEESKKCRARKILDAFREVGTIRSRLVSAKFFGGCPPPTRIRESGRIINSGRTA
jgi:hypothetical protein